MSTDIPQLAEIKTEDQARNWILELVSTTEEKRRECNVIIPDNHNLTAIVQKKAFHQFLVKHGSSLGALTALYRCNKISDICYNELRERVMATLFPTVVGDSNA